VVVVVLVDWQETRVESVADADLYLRSSSDDDDANN